MNCIEKLLSLLMCIKNHKFSYICQLFLSKVKNKKLKSHNTRWYLTEQNGSSSNEFELGVYPSQEAEKTSYETTAVDQERM